MKEENKTSLEQQILKLFDEWKENGVENPSMMEDQILDLLGDTTKQIQEKLQELRHRFVEEYLFADRYYDKNELQATIKMFLDEHDAKVLAVLVESKTVDETKREMRQMKKTIKEIDRGKVDG